MRQIDVPCARSFPQPAGQPFAMSLLLKIGLVLVLAYALVVAFLYVTQAALIFPASLARRSGLPVPEAAERLSLRTPDGETLAGLLFRTPEPDAPLLIGFGGNAQNAQELGTYLADIQPDYDIAVFHYRGYHPSTGSPSERAVLADTLLIHDHLVGRLAPRAVYALGISLGSGMATYLSQERPLAGIVLLTPYDSIEAVAKQLYFWAPVGWLLRHRFPSDRHMTGNPTPTAIIAAERDRVVPPARTQALAAVVDNLVFNRILPGAAHDTPLYDEALVTAIRDAFAAVEAAARDREPTAASTLPAPKAEAEPAPG